MEKRMIAWFSVQRWGHLSLRKCEHSREQLKKASNFYLYVVDVCSFLD